MSESRARQHAIFERRALLTELDDAVNELLTAVEATAHDSNAGDLLEISYQFRDWETVKQLEWYADAHDTSDNTVIVEAAADDLKHRLEN